jgi:hypothetical protein
MMICRRQQGDAAIHQADVVSVVSFNPRNGIEFESIECGFGSGTTEPMRSHYFWQIQIKNVDLRAIWIRRKAHLQTGNADLPLFVNQKCA